MRVGIRQMGLWTLSLILVPAFASDAAAQLTRQNWVEKVAGFSVDLSGVPKAGLVIDSGNLESYKKFIPYGTQLLIRQYNFKIYVKDYQPIVPADTYITATNKYRGKAVILDIGDKYREVGIRDYVAGLPFPNPKNGLEIAWNYTYAYGGDDSENYFSVFWIDAKRGVERSEDWIWVYINRAVRRTDIEPLPDFEEAAKKGIQYYSYTTCLAPHDKKGFTALYTRMIAPKDQQGYIYIPAQRRTTRFAFGTRGESWNNTDLLYEDVRGYLGYPEWMHWKIIGKKTMLLPMNAGVKHGKEAVKKLYDFQNPPHWNFKALWEPRPVYILEVKAKFKYYPYSKMIFYIDAETFFIAAKDAYDKKGQMWKVLLNAWNTSLSPRTEPSIIGTSLIIDLQLEHATAFGWTSSRPNLGLTPDQFTLTRLRKLGQ